MLKIIKLCPISVWNIKIVKNTETGIYINVLLIVLIHNRLLKNITAETVDLVFKKVIFQKAKFSR